MRVCVYICSVCVYICMYMCISMVLMLTGETPQCCEWAGVSPGSAIDWWWENWCVLSRLLVPCCHHASNWTGAGKQGECALPAAATSLPTDASPHCCCPCHSSVSLFLFPFALSPLFFYAFLSFFLPPYFSHSFFLFILIFTGGVKDGLLFQPLSPLRQRDFAFIFSF